jgi:hypothetical protein
VIEHRCARGEHCAHAETIEYEHCTGDCDCHLGPHYACSVPGGCGHLHVMAGAEVGEAIEQPYGLCPVCELVVADALADLPHDYVSLRIAQYRGISPAVGELVKATKDLPVPISLALATLADQIEIEVTAFAEPVAEKLNIDWDRSTTPKVISRFGSPPKYLGPVVLQKAAHLLSGATDILLSLPPWEYRLWGDEGWVEVEATGVEAALILLALHQAARAALGLTRAMVTMQAPCPWCKSQTLVQEAGKDFKQCQLCRTRFTDREYEQLTIITLGDHPKPPKKPQRRARQGREEIRSVSEGTVGRPDGREVG